MSETAAFGDHLRDWRKRRRMSQLELACDADISTRHLSFVETGRARPSREMVLRLAEHLEVPPRDRNLLLAAAGFAPALTERSIHDPEMAAALRAVQTLLDAHQPYPALAVDRHWRLVAANPSLKRLLGADPNAPAEPVNVLRASLDPQGLGRAILNYGQWREHILVRLGEQVRVSADPVLEALRDELAAFPAPDEPAVGPADDFAGVAIPFQLATPGGVLSFFTTTTMFGTPVDITLAEIAIETFLPANPETAAAMQAMNAG